MTTTVTKAQTFYGITAKQFKAIIAQENNPKKLGDMLAFIRKRIADHQAKGAVSKVSRWERVSEALVAKLNGTPVAAPALANAATFTMKPLPAKKTSRKAKSVGFDLDSMIKSSGMTPEELILKISQRI